MAIESHGEEKFESGAVSVRAVLFAALGALLLLALAIGMLQAIFYWQVSVEEFAAPKAFPQPRVQTGQAEQRQHLEAAQESRLTGYRWADRDKGLVQIPIERAMQILAGEGAKAYAPLAPPQALSSPSAGAERLITPVPGVPPPGQMPPAGATTTPETANAPPLTKAGPGSTPAAGTAPEQRP